ncbi:uncharacterized protein PHACADRAFT_253949 [Phanerochaete carnosa HHB-10118-sp]|uniref:Uncharacterized protein n=1 Tax=Phanerochaete carnosa (strain HHB-10118-sp) TaxID=650164 RepID=K5V2D3_PHACS|nr:uncharacterized protein PHACADRAFT_253949 [Phanerochaete carnosa HHB-10118-sp]EKM56686.1 hypothetical protein PHACADRAFT_253949 [Phanerochaete carnosa HHB-10118-sp]
MHATLTTTRIAYSSTVTRTRKPKRRDSVASRCPAFYDPPSPSQYDEPPSAVVEDLTLVSYDDSTLSADTPLGRSPLKSPRTPAWKAFPAIEESPNLSWAEDVTLTSTPQCGRKSCSPQKLWLDASMLKEYPKSPPLKRFRADSLRTFASSMEALEKMSNSAALMTTLHPECPVEKRGRKRAMEAERKSPAVRGGKARTSTSPQDTENQPVHTTQSSRKRGPGASLRESHVQNLPRHQDPMTSLDPRYVFEYQLTLGVLDAMDHAPLGHPRSAEQSEKKSKRLSASFAQTLGSLKRRVPSPRSSIPGL